MNAAPVVVYIGLGSNLDGPAQHVRAALLELGELSEVQLIRHSTLFESPPLGPPGQPDYVNAVAMLVTSLDAYALLDQLQALEQRHGRQRGERWGARSLDLDLLLYGQDRINSPRLQVPHPQMLQRAFVLVPLFELAPELVMPGIGPLADAMPGVSDQRLRPLSGQGDAG